MKSKKGSAVFTAIGSLGWFQIQRCGKKRTNICSRLVSSDINAIVCPKTMGMELEFEVPLVVWKPHQGMIIRFRSIYSSISETRFYCSLEAYFTNFWRAVLLNEFGRNFSSRCTTSISWKWWALYVKINVSETIVLWSFVHLGLLFCVNTVFGSRTMSAYFYLYFNKNIDRNWVYP